MNTQTPSGAEISIDQAAEGTLLLTLSGNWRMGFPAPSSDHVMDSLSAHEHIHKILFDSRNLSSWDSALPVFLSDLKPLLDSRDLSMDTRGLPEGVRNMLAIASAVPEKREREGEAPNTPFLVSIGRDALAFFSTVSEMLAFIGALALSFGRMLSGRKGFRAVDFVEQLRQCGAEALPIVSMISLLVGLIFAFIGAIQLSMFGAQIYVADLVCIAMARVMAAVMTGVIMTGRTGAAFAAQLGTMQVNEELDALEVMGISPMDFLVMPRVLALTLMMPLLCLYAVLMGILGGLIVGVFLLDLSLAEYFIQTRKAFQLTHLWIGLVHALVFGVLVSMAGCLRGLQCGRSASSVGRATTSAVVTGIVSIVLATALITLVCNVIGI